MKENIITHYIQRGRNFTIVKNEEGFYLAIEDKYITDGRLNKALNGLEMRANKDLTRCLDTLRDTIEIEYLESQGYTRAEAFAKYYNMPDKLEELKKIFA